MKKLILLIFCVITILSTVQSQDFGYRTTDVGVEYQWQPKSQVFALHFAYNLQVHHSFQARLGYTKTNWLDKGRNDNEEGSGFGGSLGYRYYIMVMPKDFFIGLRADIWQLKVFWERGTLKGTSNITALQPALEMGYTFLLNDQIFITPAVTCGSQQNIKVEGRVTGEGLMLLMGVSAGWRF
ncbi:MAG TPA: hypothetical protein VLJ68_03825 [Chitinophagaceae bacterium]|nr:hypothetical protein [Chitinophagaceae bacterium]